MATPPMDGTLLVRLLKLRLEGGRGPTAIGTALGLTRGTVRKYLERAEAAGITVERLSALTESEVLRLLVPQPEANRERPEPDWPRIHLELRRPHVTRQLVWEEYRDLEPLGYEYSRFCELYLRFLRCLPPTMRQLHVPGERLFVDFSGGTLPFIDAAGHVRFAKLFIAVLGGSSLTYVEPASDETLATWVACHVRALEYFGGVPRLWVPDNLRAGVTKADRYEALINRTYAELAEHYGAAVFATRSRKPRDKAKAEAGVLVSSRWILAVLRNLKGATLPQLRAAVRPLVERINARTMRHLGRSRRELFDQAERAALLPLPSARYEWSEWGTSTVGTDYHVMFDDHAYSVPHPLNGRTLAIRATPTTVEILNGKSRVASHPRSRQVGGKSTLRDHMPVAHREYSDWTPEKLKLSAAAIGPNTARFAEALLHEKPHPTMGARACLGLLSLTHRFPPERLEAACTRALRLQAISLRSIRSILTHNLDREQPAEDQAPLPMHENIRGPDYYE